LAEEDVESELFDKKGQVIKVEIVGAAQTEEWLQ